MNKRLLFLAFASLMVVSASAARIFDEYDDEEEQQISEDFIQYEFYAAGSNSTGTSFDAKGVAGLTHFYALFMSLFMVILTIFA